MSRKSRRGVRRPAGLNREFMNKIRWKKKVHGSWKEGLATWEEYKMVARGYREATRKAKASMEFNLARQTEDNRKGFFKYIAGRTNTRGNTGPLLNASLSILRSLTPSRLWRKTRLRRRLPWLMGTGLVRTGLENS